MCYCRSGSTASAGLKSGGVTVDSELCVSNNVFSNSIGHRRIQAEISTIIDSAGSVEMEVSKYRSLGGKNLNHLYLTL